MTALPAPRTFHIKSFGCQMNVYDGERMAELLGAQGMTASEDRADADLVVLNTCHIREKGGREGLFGHWPDRQGTSRPWRRGPVDRGRGLRCAGPKGPR